MNVSINRALSARQVALWAGVALFLAVGAIVRAEVVDATEAGFTIRNTATIAAAPADVYTKLVNDIGRWWDPEHTYSKNAGNLSLDGRAGGLFLEKLENGGSVAHMAVVFAAPGKTLRMAGGMGPLQAFGLSGSMTWQFAPDGAGTRIELMYAVGGYKPGGLQAMAPVVDKVLAEQLLRLKAYVEKR